MAQVSQGRRMPKGYIYYDKSSKGGKYRHNRWCAEIYFANVRLRKRSCDRTELERWLELVSTTIRKSLIWQIDEAYVKGKWSLCRKLIQTMPEGLADYLPQESVTDNGRFSPADRYAEIRHNVLHE